MNNPPTFCSVVIKLTRCWRSLRDCTVQVIMILLNSNQLGLILILILVRYCGSHQYCQYCCTNVDKPTLPLLLKFPPSCSNSDCISIPARIGQKYWYFGILLLQDNTGNIVETLEHECQKNAEMINLKICKKWINGIGLPVSWDILIQVLHDIELHKLANEIQDIVYYQVLQCHAQGKA